MRRPGVFTPGNPLSEEVDAGETKIHRLDLVKTNLTHSWDPKYEG